MATIAETIYTVRNGLKSVNLDDRYSNRFIYQLITKYTSLFIKRDSDSKKIWKLTNLFQTLPECIELVDAPLASVCAGVLIPGCNTVKRSEEPLPNFYNSTYGNFLTITTIDGGKKFEYKDPTNYAAVRKREFQSGSVGYYWLDGKYLVIPDGPDLVVVRGLFTNEVDPQTADSITSTTGTCPGILDQQFIIPDYLEGDVIRQVIQDIRNVTATLIEDQNPNLSQINKGDNQ